MKEKEHYILICVLRVIVFKLSTLLPISAGQNFHTPLLKTEKTPLGTDNIDIILMKNNFYIS